MKKIFEKEFRGRKIIVEQGEYAKQADGAVLVRYGDTVVLSTVVVSDNANILSDFFHTGVYDVHREFYKSMSPSMDILISSNLWFI